MKFMVGADPEVFVINNTGQFVSAHNMIAGTKKDPFPVERGAVQVDGMALEFNIDPAENRDAFLLNIRTVMDQLQAMIPLDVDLKIVATADFEKEVMEAQPEEARRLGCDPDFNAYTGQENPAPNQHPVMRTAAGHIHVGWTKNADFDAEHFSMCTTLVKQLDFFLGLPSLILDHDERRRQMYGKAGAFRPKKYGAEYRVLSNFWLASPELTRWAFDNTKAGFDRLIAGDYLPEALQRSMDRNADELAEHAPKDMVRKIIDSADKQAAIEICDKYHINYKV